MPLFRFDATLVFFAHIPKTGGSTIERAFLDMGGKQALLLKAVSTYSKCTPQHMHAEIFEAYLPAGFCDLGFTVVRDPLARLISEYKMRRAGRARRKLPPLTFGEWVNLAFSRYKPNPYVFDNHIRPQVEFVGAEIEVFRFEDGLENVLAEIGSRLGIDAPKPAHIRQSEQDQIEVLPETAARIADFYREDYAQFGYPLPQGG